MAGRTGIGQLSVGTGSGKDGQVARSVPGVSNGLCTFVVYADRGLDASTDRIMS